MSRPRRFHLRVETRLRLVIASATLLAAATALIFYLLLDELRSDVDALVDDQTPALQAVLENQSLLRQAESRFAEAQVGWRDLGIEVFFDLLKKREDQPRLFDHPFVAGIEASVVSADQAARNIDRLAEGETAEKLAADREAAEQSWPDQVATASALVRQFAGSLRDLRTSEPFRYERDSDKVSSEVAQLEQRQALRQTDLEDVRERINRVLEDVPVPTTVLAELREREATLQTAIRQIEQDIERVNLRGVRLPRTPDERERVYRDIESALLDTEIAAKASLRGLDVTLQSAIRAAQASLSDQRQLISVREADVVDSMVLVLIGVALVGVILFLLAPRQVALPMKRLISLIEDIRDGRYQIMRKLETNDDIGTLFRKLHALAETEQRLEARRRDLIAIRDKRLSILAERMPPIMIVSSDRRINYVNDAFLQLADVPRESLSGMLIDANEVTDAMLNGQLVGVLVQGLEKRERLDERQISQLRPVSREEEDQPMNLRVSTHFIRDLRGDVVEMLVIVTADESRGWEHIFEVTAGRVASSD